MIKFVKIDINPSKGLYKNTSYIVDIVELAKSFKSKIFDDYFYQSGLIEVEIIRLIERTSPYFWVMTNRSGVFKGFVYLDDLQGGENRLHSATVTTCVNPRYWGKFTKYAGKRFVKYVFAKLGLHKLKAEVYEGNNSSRVLLDKIGFKPEYKMKSETIVKGKPVDIEVYSVIRK